MCWPIFSAKLKRFVRAISLPGKVGGELVRFVEDHQIPRREAELVLGILVARHLVEPDDEVVVVLKGIAAGRGGFEFPGKDAELQAKFLKQFVAPLLHQAAGSDDENAAGVGPHEQFADVEAGHDGLARARVVGQHEAQGLARQHGFVDRGDLVRERVHVRGVDGHHGVEEKGEVDALGLDGELEGFAVAVEGPGALLGGKGDRGLVGPSKQALLEGAVGRLVDDLHRAFGDGNDGDNRGDRRRFEAGEGIAGGQVFKAHIQCLSSG